MLSISNHHLSTPPLVLGYNASQLLTAPAACSIAGIAIAVSADSSSTLGPALSEGAEAGLGAQVEPRKSSAALGTGLKIISPLGRHS
jgi:hypothetical protein